MSERLKFEEQVYAYYLPLEMLSIYDKDEEGDYLDDDMKDFWHFWQVSAKRFAVDKTDNSAEIAKLQAENEALRKFARSIIFPSGEYLTGDLEGDYVESMARRYGLLELKIMNERCGENCVCADYDAEFPTACNRTTSLIRKESE
jgi:hypothetical protein